MHVQRIISLQRLSTNSSMIVLGVRSTYLWTAFLVTTRLIFCLLINTKLPSSTHGVPMLTRSFLSALKMPVLPSSKKCLTHFMIFVTFFSHIWMTSLLIQLNDLTIQTSFTRYFFVVDIIVFILICISVSSVLNLIDFLGLLSLKWAFVYTPSKLKLY